ncbi:MAG: zinc-finger domain-containing protein [Geminicoccaceae bacterium]
MAKVRTGGSIEVFMLDGEEVALTDAMHVSCTGALGTLGHPIEYLTLEKGGQAVCNYCDRRFIHVSHADAARVRKEGERVAEPGRVA